MRGRVGESMLLAIGSFLSSTLERSRRRHFYSPFLPFFFGGGRLEPFRPV